MLIKSATGVCWIFPIYSKLFKYAIVFSILVNNEQPTTDRSWLKHSENPHSNASVLEDEIFSDTEFIDSIKNHKELTKEILVSLFLKDIRVPFVQSKNDLMVTDNGHLNYLEFITKEYFEDHINEINKERTLIRVIDLLAKEVDIKKNLRYASFFFIYDDGTVEKKIIIE